MSQGFFGRGGRAVCAVLGLAVAAIGAVHAQPKPPVAPAKTAATPAKTPAVPAKPVVTVPPARPAAKVSAPAKLDVAAVLARLASPDTVAAGLAEATAAGDAAGDAAKKLAPRIEELLQKGLPAELAIAAMGALGAIGAPSSSAVIAPYVRHRNPEVRKAAALALGQTRGPEAAAALRRGLRSSDAVLRGLSASGLRFAGDGESVPDLLRALDRGVIEAAVSIGALCSGASCGELLARWEKLDLDAAKATFEVMLQRKPALPDDVLLQTLSKVKSAVGSGAKTYFPPLKVAFKGSKKVQKTLELAVKSASEAKP